MFSSQVKVLKQQALTFQRYICMWYEIYNKILINPLRIKSFDPISSNLGRSGLSQEFTGGDVKETANFIQCYNCNAMDPKDEKVKSTNLVC